MGQGLAVRQDGRRPQGRRDRGLRLRGQPVKRYKLTAAWPKSLEIGTLKAGDTSVLTEKLVLTYEKLRARVMRRGHVTALTALADRQAREPSGDATRETAYRVPFLLPRGYVDSSGTVHRHGVDATGDGQRRIGVAA